MHLLFYEGSVSSRHPQSSFRCSSGLFVSDAQATRVVVSPKDNQLQGPLRGQSRIHDDPWVRLLLN